MNFVFYDFETTGTSTRYDQFHQLGAILTNSDFKELERFEIRCQLAPHIIPGPKALEITRVSPCLLYTSPSPRDAHESRMPSSA